MGLAKLFGALFIVPTTLLLTISFLVLYLLRKLSASSLKTFGYVIVVLLWISSVCTFSAGVATATKALYRKSMMHSWMQDHNKKKKCYGKKKWHAGPYSSQMGPYEKVFERN